MGLSWWGLFAISSMVANLEGKEKEKFLQYRTKFASFGNSFYICLVQKIAEGGKLKGSRHAWSLTHDVSQMFHSTAIGCQFTVPALYHMPENSPHQIMFREFFFLVLGWGLPRHIPNHTRELSAPKLKPRDIQCCKRFFNFDEPYCWKALIQRNHPMYRIYFSGVVQKFGWGLIPCPQAAKF